MSSISTPHYAYFPAPPSSCQSIPASQTVNGPLNYSEDHPDSPTQLSASAWINSTSNINHPRYPPLADVDDEMASEKSALQGTKEVKGELFSEGWALADQDGQPDSMVTAGQLQNASVSSMSTSGSFYPDFSAPTFNYPEPSYFPHGLPSAASGDYRPHCFGDYQYASGPPCQVGYLAWPDTGGQSRAPTVQVSEDSEERRDGGVSEHKHDGTPYAQLIYSALMDAPGHRMVLKDIYRWIEENTDKGKDASFTGWQNSVRHNLSMNQAFRKLPYRSNKKERRTGFIWALEELAIRQGILPTTRYRKKGDSSKKRSNGAKARAKGRPARPRPSTVREMPSARYYPNFLASDTSSDNMEICPRCRSHHSPHPPPSVDPLQQHFLLPSPGTTGINLSRAWV